MISIAAAAVTHPGLVRSTNEDSVLVTDWLVAVADGLGGHAAGEVASQLAVARMRELAEQPTINSDDVTAAIADVNRLILEKAESESGYAGMGTTLCGMGVVSVGGSQHCIVFNVGDSRVYRFQDGQLQQVTVDHSELQELRDAGQISEQAAQHYLRRNVVTRSMGSEPAPTPDLWVFPPSAQERFLVCSDGLTTEVDDALIARTLAEHPDPGPAASTLLEQALAAGGRDNIAVIVVNLDNADSGLVPADTAPRTMRSRAGGSAYS